MAVLKFPPPPQLPKELGALGQQLNRWLIEIQSILNAGGDIDPSSIQGLAALFLQVAAMQIQVNANTANIATNTANIATNTANIATLTARNQVLNGTGVPGVGLGSDGDLYINNTGGAGTRLYSKIAGAWVATA